MFGLETVIVLVTCELSMRRTALRGTAVIVAALFTGDDRAMSYDARCKLLSLLVGRDRVSSLSPSVDNR